MQTLDIIKRYLWSQNDVGHSKLILVKKQTNKMENASDWKEEKLSKLIK